MRHGGMYLSSAVSNCLIASHWFAEPKACHPGRSGNRLGPTDRQLYEPLGVGAQVVLCPVRLLCFRHRFRRGDVFVDVKPITVSGSSEYRLMVAFIIGMDLTHGSHQVAQACGGTYRPYFVDAANSATGIGESNARISDPVRGPMRHCLRSRRAPLDRQLRPLW